MSLITRIKTGIAAKINKLLDNIEDPRETLDYSYEKQLDLLTKVKKGITDIVTAKKQLEHQKENLNSSLSTLDEQAKEALKQGNEPLARIVLERKNKTNDDIISLGKQIKGIDEKQKKLIETEKNLQIKVSEFRAKKETIKAQYTAAEAEAKIGESLTGIGDDIGNVGDAVRRAEDKTEVMKARGAAISELVDAGVLDDTLGCGGDPIDKELSKMRNKGKVDTELEALKKEVEEHKGD